MFGRNLNSYRRQGGMGLGFRGSSPSWPYVGGGRGGLPRCGFSASISANTLSVGMNREQEISWLKSQAENIKKDLLVVESRISDLEKSE